MGMQDVWKSTSCPQCFHLFFSVGTWRHDHGWIRAMKILSIKYRGDAGFKKRSSNEFLPLGTLCAGIFPFVGMVQCKY